MNMQLWQGRFESPLDAQVNDFNASIRIDKRMVKEDIGGSIAHATMLGACGIISKEDSGEEVMWMQYSRTKWYNEGDRNSKYFHVIANGRRRRNKILSLKLESGEWSYDPDEIMEMGRRFFENLYTSSEVYNGSLVYGCTYPRIDENSLSMLGRGVLCILSALFSATTTVQKNTFCYCKKIYYVI